MNEMHDKYADFIDGFADATGLERADADAAWAAYSRNLSEADRIAVEREGYPSGEEMGEEYAKHENL